MVRLNSWVPGSACGRPGMTEIIEQSLVSAIGEQQMLKFPFRA
jgi:hypothetical protein